MLPVGHRGIQSSRWHGTTEVRATRNSVRGHVGRAHVALPLLSVCSAFRVGACSIFLPYLAKMSPKALGVFVEPSSCVCIFEVACGNARLSRAIVPPLVGGVALRKRGAAPHLCLWDGWNCGRCFLRSVPKDVQGAGGSRGA
jgi:hypothetical protein